jgi:hypothetical membrane protein
MKSKTLLIFGACAPILYLFTVVLGGLLNPHYSPVSNAISELILAGAPNKTLLDSLFILYNLLVCLGAWGLVQLYRSRPLQSRLAVAVALAMLTVGLAGILMTAFFPQDPRGAPATFTGTMHLVTAGIESLGCMGAMLMFGLHYRAIPAMRGFNRLTFFMLALVFISGGLSAALIGCPVMGLLERTTIGASLLWQFLLFLTLLRSLPVRIPAHC